MVCCCWLLLAVAGFHRVRQPLWQCRGGLSDPRRASGFAEARVRQRIAGLYRRQELCLQFVVGGFAEGYRPYQLARLGAECIRDLSWLGGGIVVRGWLRSLYPGWDSWIWRPCAADRSEWLREPECWVEVGLHVQGGRVVVELCESSLLRSNASNRGPPKARARTARQGWRLAVRRGRAGSLFFTPPPVAQCWRLAVRRGGAGSTRRGLIVLTCALLG